MAQQTLSALGILAQQVADETAPGANTADRVGTILQNIIDSCGKNEYIALVTQSSTSAPTASVIKNTLGGTVVWSRTGKGSYLGTLSGAFPSAKTVFPRDYVMYSSAGSDYSEIQTSRASDNAIQISTLYGPNGSATNTDGILTAFLVIVQVYP